MKKALYIILTMLSAMSCTSTKKLTYLNNLPDTSEVQYFPYEMESYRVQYRDILFINAKTLNPEGKIEDLLQGTNNMNMTYMQGESGQYLIGYNIDKEGNILLPVLGKINVQNKTLPIIREIVQHKFDSVFNNNAFVDVKLLSFRYTVLGEARNPGTFINYNDYLTIFEAIGRAGGVGDFGRRDQVLVIRSNPDGSVTYRINLLDKNILTSKAYFLMPNDVVIIEPLNHKIFNLNLPTISFILSAITGAVTTTLLLINYWNK